MIPEEVDIDEISIHTSREGCDAKLTEMVTALATAFQSTHPVRDATLKDRAYPRLSLISIHTSREGCDGFVQGFYVFDRSISIHTSREGCDYNMIYFKRRC